MAQPVTDPHAGPTDMAEADLGLLVALSKIPCLYLDANNPTIGAMAGSGCTAWVGLSDK